MPRSEMRREITAALKRIEVGREMLGDVDTIINYAGSAEGLVWVGNVHGPTCKPTLLIMRIRSRPTALNFVPIRPPNRPIIRASLSCASVCIWKNRLFMIIIVCSVVIVEVAWRGHGMTRSHGSSLFHQLFFRSTGQFSMLRLI